MYVKKHEILTPPLPSHLCMHITFILNCYSIGPRASLVDTGGVHIGILGYFSIALHWEHLPWWVIHKTFDIRTCFYYGFQAQPLILYEKIWLCLWHSFKQLFFKAASPKLCLV